MKKIQVTLADIDQDKRSTVTINVFKIESFQDVKIRVGGYYNRGDKSCLRVNLDSGKKMFIESNTTEFNKIIDKLFEL